MIAVARRSFTLLATDTISLRTADAARTFVRPPPRRATIRSFSDLYSAFAMDRSRQPDLPRKPSCARLNDGWLVLNYHDLPDENSLLYHSRTGYSAPCCLRRPSGT